jgi:hypothetical protein
LDAVKKFKESINRKIELNDNTREMLEEPLEHLHEIESRIGTSLTTATKQRTIAPSGTSTRK